MSAPDNDREYLHRMGRAYQGVAVARAERIRELEAELAVLRAAPAPASWSVSTYVRPPGTTPDTAPAVWRARGVSAATDAEAVRLVREDWIRRGWSVSVHSDVCARRLDPVWDFQDECPECGDRDEDDDGHAASCLCAECDEEPVEPEPAEDVADLCEVEP